MSDEMLRTALDGLRVRLPESAVDAAALRAEVRAADAALGVLLQRASADRFEQPSTSDENGGAA